MKRAKGLKGKTGLEEFVRIIMRTKACDKERQKRLKQVILNTPEVDKESTFRIV